MNRLGVDVGGTFTDFMYWDDESGSTVIHKRPSTPHDPSEATLLGAEELMEMAGLALSDLEMFFHGTTVATNIVLQHKGCRVGLITTAGFRDVLHIARKKRPFNFSSYQDLPWQRHELVPRRFRRVVTERIDADGTVVTPLDPEDVRREILFLREAEVDAVAVCFLHSYRNDEHEQIAKAVIEQEWPNVFVSISSGVAPQYREYERFSTAALNAYVGPEVSGYIRRLTNGVRDRGIADQVHLMTSSGGILTGDAAADQPVSMLVSGPVAGLRAALEIGRASGYESVISLDVGGTSADVGVAPDGAVRMKHLLDTRVGDYHAMVPMAEVDTIGTGGGSIAFVDEGGMFRVGPRSAGADPGPACYGRGGTEPTATDAMVSLGWLGEKSLLGGSMDIDPEAARRALAIGVAEKLGLDIDEAALGVFRILANLMADAISLHSVQKGYDPRDFTLVPAGGAGPLFAFEVARLLGIGRILVPNHPGIASAMGLLMSDVTHEVPATVWQDSGDPDLDDLSSEFDRLEAVVIARLQEDGFSDRDILLSRYVDCRYVGQGYELRVDAPAGAITHDWVTNLMERFERLHEKTYSQRFSENRMLMVNIRVSGSGRLPRLRFSTVQDGVVSAAEATIGKRKALFPINDEPTPRTFTAPVLDRTKLGAGSVIEGPAIIEQMDSTTIVGPVQIARLDQIGHLVIEERN